MPSLPIEDTLVIDVDKTVCIPEGDYKDRKPYPYIKELLETLRAAGYKLHYHTARYMWRTGGNQLKAHELGYQELKDWMDKYEIPYDQLYFGKPGGIIIDDMAVYVDSDEPQSWLNVVKRLGFKLDRVDKVKMTDLIQKTQYNKEN